MHNALLQSEREKNEINEATETENYRFLVVRRNFLICRDVVARLGWKWFFSIRFSSVLFCHFVRFCLVTCWAMQPQAHWCWAKWRQRFIVSFYVRWIALHIPSSTDTTFSLLMCVSAIESILIKYGKHLLLIVVVGAFHPRSKSVGNQKKPS